MGGISWIKIETTFPRKPVVFVVASSLNIDTNTAIGALVSLLCWADGVSDDGSLGFSDPAFVDKVTSCDGLGAALMDAGWIVSDEGGNLRMNNWNVHNGECAKKRAMNARKVAKCKARKRDEVTENGYQGNQKWLPQTAQAVTEKCDLDKIREEYKRNTNVFPKEREREKASALNSSPSSETYSIQDGAATWICPKNKGDDRFLDAYAKRPKSVRAYQVEWATAIKRVDPEILISCAQIYREQMTDEDYRYQLAPENWLADRRYEQYMGEAKSRSTFARTTVMLAPLPGEED